MCPILLGFDVIRDKIWMATDAFLKDQEGFPQRF